VGLPFVIFMNWPAIVRRAMPERIYWFAVTSYVMPRLLQSLVHLYIGIACLWFGSIMLSGTMWFVLSAMYFAISACYFGSIIFQQRQCGSRIMGYSGVPPLEVRVHRGVWYGSAPDDIQEGILYSYRELLPDTYEPRHASWQSESTPLIDIES